MQLISDICNLLQLSAILLVISSNKYRHLYFIWELVSAICRCL